MSWDAKGTSRASMSYRSIWSSTLHGVISAIPRRRSFGSTRCAPATWYYVIGFLSGPPCCTWSTARGKKMQETKRRGPRVIRDCDALWGYYSVSLRRKTTARWQSSIGIQPACYDPLVNCAREWCPWAPRWADRREGGEHMSTAADAIHH